MNMMTRWKTTLSWRLLLVACIMMVSVIAVVCRPMTANAAVSYRTVVHARHLPPGVRHVKTPRSAALDATWKYKYKRLLSVAKSKLGTPYRWGHNEDRGQYGFDCSNYVEYVYHHGLGYKFSGASKVQARSVGWKVPKKDMRKGDLLIFEHGKHVGIYIGYNKMIQEGGGAGKVAIMSIAPGYYWHYHLTAVKRMF